MSAIALLAFAGTAHAQRLSNISGGKLGDICISKSSAQLEACDAYLDGIADGISFYQHLMPQDGSKGGKLPDYVCVPGPTTGPQLRQTYVAWLREHKEAQRGPAAQAAMRAFNDSYKCPGEQTK
ncbi:MAG: Rap1a/Tai family immunity protein [Acetobacteraceae bacterium]|nr:Rap1a/Tai family immunity protein [Acetobacteraceae bacterium]